MKNNKVIATLGALLLAGCQPSTQYMLEVVDLRVESAISPVGIDESTPHFSWKLQTTQPMISQRTYEITVKADSKDSTVVWQSGKVKSDLSVNIPYAGKALSPRTRYLWQVTVRDNNGKTATSAQACFETGLMGGGWAGAQWLQTDKTIEAKWQNTIDFRQTFKLQKAIAKARLYISGLGIYDTWLNGKRVGTPSPEGMVYDELKPGWTSYLKTVFYSAYDVTSLLQLGTNTIGTVLSDGWWAGSISGDFYGKNKSLGVIFRLDVEFADGTTLTIVSDPKLCKSRIDENIRQADLYDGEQFDAGKELISHWSKPAYNDKQWAATVVNKACDGKLTSFVGPTVQVRKPLTRTPKSITVYQGTTKTESTYGMVKVVQHYDKPAFPLTLKKGETAIFDMGQNMVGWVNTKIKSAKRTSIDMRFAEMLNDTGAKERGNDGPGGSIYRLNMRAAKTTTKWLTKGDPQGEEFHPSMTFFCFRYVEVVAADDIQITSLTGEVVGSALRETSHIETDNKDINQLFDNIIWGQRGNFLSIPTDCPQRDERLGWTGDIEVFGRTATYNSDAYMFLRKWMGDMRDDQNPNGAYPSTAPAGKYLNYGQSAWADAGIIIPWTLYLMYGDKRIIEENFASMELYMHWLSEQKDDTWQYNGAGTAYGDWLAYAPTDNRYMSVCYYAYDALLMSKMCKALSQKTDDTFARKAAEYDNLYTRIRDEFRKRYVNADGTLGQNTQTAYLFALKLNLLPDDARDKGIRHLATLITNNGNRLSTGFLGTSILNQTLSELGLSELAYKLLLQHADPSWLYSVDQGATTILERWNSYTINKGFGDPGMNSFNHYAYGVIGEWMYRYMLGIEADETTPGFKHFILQPEPDPTGGLKWAKGYYDSNYGRIESGWEKTETGYRYTFTVPANTTATLRLQASAAKRVTSNGKALHKADGVKRMGEEKGKQVYLLQSGKYIVLTQ